MWVKNWQHFANNHSLEKECVRRNYGIVFCLWYTVSNSYIGIIGISNYSNIYYSNSYIGIRNSEISSRVIKYWEI